jgi:hypothetical protein
VTAFETKRIFLQRRRRIKKASKMAFAPKKDGGPNLKFYESHETLLLFEGVKTWLLKNCKKVNIHRQ